MACTPICSTEDRPAVAPGSGYRIDPLCMPGTFLDLLSEQAGRCAVCSEDLVVPPNVPDQLAGVIDRDSATEVVRGLLCKRCHQGLTLFGANPLLMQQAAAYLDRGRASVTVPSAAR